ncbi:MAG: IgGFc-binding protein, partial [Candidatus Kapabacteria bacterium]|nr:IgGFc-binding protein [Candidatus Kapabacteria bacterium]
MKKYFLLVVAFFCLCTISTISQTTKSMLGKKFFIAWPFNGGTDDSTFCNFSIHSPNKQTSGIIRTADTTIHFTLSNLDGVLSFASSTPINGNNYFSQYEVRESEVIENKGVYIETNDEVFVYISTVNSIFFGEYKSNAIDSLNSSEATIVYPINSLNTNYFILTKSEDSSASQFLIVATEDSTQIEILPSQNTEKGRVANIPFTINLQKGQTYLVRSPYSDLTGSKVQSIGTQCKPFAVFVGSPRTTIVKTSIPNTHRYSTYLEQLPPPETAGKRYLVSRIALSTIIRVMALHDSTQILLSGQYYGSVLSAGRFIDIDASTDLYFYSDKPLLVAQFTKSSNFVPTMVFISPVEYMQSKFVFPSHLFTNKDRYDSFYPGPYINVVIRCEDIPNLYINGSLEFHHSKTTPWRVFPDNPLFCTCSFYPGSMNQSKILQNLSGRGLSAYYYEFSRNSFAMQGVTSFERTLYNKIDTSGSFSYFSYCQNGVSTFEASADSSANSFYWEFGDGFKAEGRTVHHLFKNSGPHTVKLIVYRKAFCSYDTVRRLINVREPLAVRTGSRPIIRLCKGETVQIGRLLDTSLTYRWSPSVGLSDSTIAVTTATVFQDTMKYYLLGYDQFGCVGLDSITIVMYKQPIANAGPDTVSCGGNGVQIGRQTTGGTPNYSFLWTPATGLSNDKIERPIAAPSANTTYILRVTDANGCMGYDTVNIQALPSPTIDAGNSTTICDGDSVQLTASGAPTYRWVNARNISDTTIGNPTVYPSVTTTYYVAGLFETGCVAFDSVLVTVTPKPRLPIAFQTTACPNATKTYTVNQIPNTTYLWEIVGGNLTSGQGTNEATVVWGTGPTGSIKLTTTTTAGSCTFDTTVNITISSSIKPTITENKKNTIVPSLGTVRICPNESVTLDVGVGYTEITWTNGSTSRQTTVNSEGWIGVQVKDATGCSGGDSVFVQIVPPPTVFAGNDRVLCGADTAVMRPTVTGSGNYAYQWIPPTAVSDPTAQITNFIAPNTTNLIFQAIDTA